MEVKPGYKQTDVGVIPEEWHVSSLGMHGTTYGGLTGKTKRDFGLGDARYVTFMNVMSNVVINCDIFEHVRVESSESQNPVRLNDLLFNGSSESPEEVAFCAVVPQEVAGLYLNSFCFGYRLQHGALVNPLFLAYLYRSQAGRQLVKPLAQGSTRYNISKGALLGVSLALPPFREQHAIAAALSDVDGLLSGLDRLIAKKRDLKQATMQQLLTGQTRLPGFNSEWRKVKISDLCEYVSGTKTSGGDKGYVEIGDVDVVRKSYSLSQKEKLSVPGAVSVPAGTLLISTVRPTRGAIAITNESCYVSSAFCRLQPINGLLFHLVCQPQFLAYLGENAIGGTYPTCRDETILDYETAVPRDHEEQIAIATLLFDMDAESAALEARRDKIQALKQGMMQELLTGRIRLLQPEALHA